MVPGTHNQSLDPQTDTDGITFFAGCFGLPAVLTFIGMLLSGCAGPATPLGAPWATTSDDVKNGPLSFIASLFEHGASNIKFDPPHQVLHGPSPLKITITDPKGIKSNYKLVVRHNGLDVTTSFLRQATTTVRKDRIVLDLPVLRLPPERDHLIEVIYGVSTDLAAYARYETPLCRAYDQNRIQRLNGFNPGLRMVDLINKISKTKGFSPAFTAAVIAQESSFNPRTVSWAKAIGLTQITPVAEDEIVTEYAGWPRYPGINELPAMFVKALVLSGNANPTNEWRLEPGMSIHGGLTYMQRLVERWNTPENMARIRSSFPDPDEALTRLVLASYNSGYTRVYNAFIRHGSAWITAPELKEARKYVNRISSFCDYFSTTNDLFSRGEVTNAEET